MTTIKIKDNEKIPKIAWSKWDKDEYTDFQTALRNSLGNEDSILEWENEIWIEMAKEING